MTFAELQQRLAAFPKVGTSLLPAAVAWDPTGRPSSTLVTLIPQ